MKKTVKTYEEDGIRYQFNSNELQVLINQKKYHKQQSGEKITKTVIMDELAEKTFVSTEAIKNWMYGYNGPSELEQVKSLGKYFQVDYHQLLKMEEGQMTATEKNPVILMNDTQAQYTKNCVRKIYLSILYFMEECFRDHKYLMSLPYDPDEEFGPEQLEVESDLEKSFNDIEALLKESMLDIPEADYKKIYDFIWTKLCDCFDYVTFSDHKFSVGQSSEKREYDWFTVMDEVGFEHYEAEYMTYLRELFADYIVK